MEALEVGRAFLDALTSRRFSDARALLTEDVRFMMLVPHGARFRSIAACETDRVHRFDAGDLGCADGLASEFRRQMQQIPVGHVLVVSTKDPAAKEDLSPLARMMGHVVHSIEAPGDGRLLVTVERGR